MPITSGKLYDKAAYWDEFYGDGKPPAPLSIDLPSDNSGSDMNDFSKGLYAGGNQMQALGSGLVAAYGSVTDNEDLLQSGMEDYVRNMNEAKSYSGAVVNFTDIGSAKDAGSWMAYSLGTLVPDIALMIGTGGVGGAIAKQAVTQGAKAFAEALAKQGAEEFVKAGLEKDAAEYIAKEAAAKVIQAKAAKAAAVTGLATSAVGSGLQGTGGSFAEILQQTGVEAPFAALGVGVATGALDALPFIRVFDGMFPATAKKDFQEFIASRLVDNAPWKIQALKDLMVIGGAEVGTEVLQALIERDAITWVNNNYGEGPAKEYGQLLTTEDGRRQLVNVAAVSLLGGTAIAAPTIAAKKVTGRYDREVNYGDDAKVVRTDTGRDPEFRSKIEEVLNFYEDPANQGKTRVGDEVQSERPVDPVTGELAITWNKDGALDPNTNRPYMQEQTSQATTIGADASEAPVNITEGALPADQQNSAVGEIQQPQTQESLSTVVVPEAKTPYGPEHRFDAPLSDVATPYQEQLLQLSIVAATPEAQDPSNLDVVVEAIDQDDVDRIFDRNASLMIQTPDRPKGKSLPTIEEAFGTEATTVTNAVAGVMADLSASGVPKLFMDKVTGVYVHDDADVEAPAMTGQRSRGVSFSRSLIGESLQGGDKLSEMAWSMTHEVYHAADFDMNLSSKNKAFGMEISDEASEPSVAMGGIMRELFNNWLDQTPTGKRFNYPFNDLQSDILDTTKPNGGLNARYRQEVFAQLGALFHSNPKELQAAAPLAYNYIKQVRDANLKTAKPPEVINETSENPRPADTSQPTGISGQVRAPPVAGSDTGVQPRSTRPDGEGSVVQGRADTPVEGSPQDTTGQRQRPDVQRSPVAAESSRTEVILKATDKKPTFKKADNWDDTGEQIITFADGDRYTVYFDDDAAEAGAEQWYTSADGTFTGAEELLGQTKAETITALQEHREKLLAAGKNSYNTPLDPQVGRETSFKAWEFISDKGQVTEKQLRTKFKGLEDNQFDNLVEGLLSETDPESVITLEDGKFLSYDYVQERDLDGLQSDIDDMNFIKKGAEYLLQKSRGTVGEKNTLPVTKITPATKDPEKQTQRSAEVVAKHPDALSSPAAWLAFERDLTGRSETLAPPYGLISLYNDMDSWVKTHAKLTPEQLSAANRGLATAKRMGELYNSGQATANATAKLLLWGLMSRRQTASGQEAGFVDLMTGSTAVSDLAQKALAGDVSDADVKGWVRQVGKLIPEGSFGRSAISNANDFGSLMQKLADPYNGGESKLQRIHDIMADSSIPTKEVRREFQVIVQGSGIDNKVFSFAQLMIGRDDVVILDRIQLNSMWDSTRYGKNIYDDLADEFSGLRGSARYEAIENSLNTRLKELYTKLGRPEDASIGRYHWESWVRDSGQIVAHPTMQGLEKDILGKQSPYAFIGAPEGKGDMYRSGAVYARDDKGTPYYVYPKSNGKMYKFEKGEFRKFLDEIPKPKNGIVPKDFKVSKFNKGTPWYEAESVSRQKLDKLVDEFSEREAAQREYASERAVTSSAPNGSRRAERNRVYKELRSPRLSDSGRGGIEGSIPRRFRRRPSKPSKVLLAGSQVSGYKRELETDARAALNSVDSYNGTVIELTKNKTNAKLFASKMEASKDASPYGAAVYVYPESEYQNMQMFMTEDGSAGIAIDNGDTIVSLYSDGTNKNVTYALASLAVEEGGIYSDAFDTELPHIYQHVGFKVISRLKWDDAQAPADWDKRTFLPYNKGEPDVVFMVVDPKYFGPYTKDTGYEVETYEEGMRSIRETRRPEQERISPKLKQAVQDRIDRKISAAELNDTFREEGRYVKPMHPDMIAPLKDDSHYVSALKRTSTERDGRSKESYWMSDALVDGQRYGSRLDIPSYSRLPMDERADIVTMHESRPNAKAGAAGRRLGYYPTISLKDVVFAVPEKGATKIAVGADKNTIATIEGNYVAADHEQNRLDFIRYMDDPAWTQISMNPERHSFYYDLANQTPVVSATQVVQVGNLVIAKDVVYDDVEKFSFIKRKQINEETGTLDDGTPSNYQFSFNDEMDSQADLARRFRETKIYRSFGDRYQALREFEDQAAEFLGYGRLPAGLSPRDQENLSHGRVQKDLDEFHKNRIDPLGEMIYKAGFDVEAVGTYLLAKHAPERNDSIAAKVKANQEKLIARTENEIERLLDDDGVDHTVALETQRELLNGYKTDPLKFQDTGSGMTYAQSLAILSMAEREGTAQAMEKIAAKVYEMHDESRARMVEAELLDSETKEDWEANFKYYVPLKGFAAQFENDEYSAGTGSRGFSIVGSESLKAKGRKTLPVNPLLQSIEDIQKKIIRARKNEVSQKLLELLSALGNAKVEDSLESGSIKTKSYTIYNNKFRPPMDNDQYTMKNIDDMRREVRDSGQYPNDPKYVVVKKGGQTFLIHFNSDTLNHSLQNMSVPMLSRASGAMDVILNGLTRFQTFRRNMLINYNPAWMVTNPIRDVATGLIYAMAESDKKGSRVQGEGILGKTVQNYFPSIRALYRYYRGKPDRDGNKMDQYAREFHEDGASTGMVMMKDKKEQLRALNSQLRKGKIKSIFSYLAKGVEDGNKTSENAIRLSAYIAARNAGTDRETAATLAKDLTVNFNRKGEDTSTFGALYLFFNAAFQGNVNFVQAMGAGTNADGSAKEFTKARMVATALVMAGFWTAMRNIDESEEDDDGELRYNDLPEHAKNRVLLVNYNSEEGAAVPLSYGYNFFTNLGRLSAEYQQGVIDGGEFGLHLWDNLLLNFLPVSYDKGDNVWQAARGFLPDALQLPVDLMVNRNFFGSEIAVEQNELFTEKSTAYASKRSTPVLWRRTAEFLNDATGGDKYKNGLLHLSPERIDYMFDYLMGAVGRVGVQSIDAISKIGTNETIDNNKLPVVGGFFKKPSDYEDRFEFYDNYMYMRGVKARLEETTRGTPEFKELQEKYKPVSWMLLGFHQQAKKDLDKIRKTRKALEDQVYTTSRESKEETRRTNLEYLLEQENKVFDAYNKRFRESRKAMD